MPMKFTAAPIQPEATQQAGAFDAPSQMARAWAIVDLFRVLTVTAAIAGVVTAIIVESWVPLAIGAALTVALGLPAWRLWRFTLRTERVVYRDEQRDEIKAGPHVIIEMTDSIKTPKGWVEKSTKRVDVGAAPSAVLDALRYMKRTGKTSREAVCGNTQLGQKPWKRLKDILSDYNVIGDGGVTEEIDQLIAQVERQIRDL